MSWAERARHGVLGAVLDPADKVGKKNKFIDHVHRMALHASLKRRRFRRALDFGCGTGRLLGLLADHADEVYALDRTPEMLEIARKVLPMAPDRFVCWRDRGLPFPNESFDLVLSAYVLSVMPRSAFAPSMRELFRVCSNEGSVILIEQVDHSRALSPMTYNETFKQVGFELVSAIPVRMSSSDVMRFASRPSTPWPFIRILAAVELRRVKDAKFPADAKGYWDYRFVLRKKAKE